MNNKDDLALRYAEAAYAENAGRFDEAFLLYSELAQLGHAGAIMGLGNMYLRGEGVVHDVAIGLAFMERAASLGVSNAAFNLGALYRTGDCGVPKDSDKSKRCFLLAKELGCELPVDKYISED